MLVAQALRVHAEVRVLGRSSGLRAELAAWCRVRGHRCNGDRVERGPGARHLATAGAGVDGVDGVSDVADDRWGLALRGALVEDGPADLAFRLTRKEVVWDDDVARLYAMAAASQWDPESAIPWDAPAHPDEAVEAAVVQVMAYLVENEMAALLVPARFIGEIHPHFREVIGLLAVNAADEARHVAVFSRRAARSGLPATSSRGGQASLATLVREPDFALASFLLSVMGETTFLELLHFLDAYAPDEATRAVARLAARDEARHVAFAVGHLRGHAERDRDLHARLAHAIDQRHAALSGTAGLNADVFDALVVLAAGSLVPSRIEVGFDAVAGLHQQMDRARRGQLRRIGFPEAETHSLSSLHTRNFM